MGVGTNNPEGAAGAPAESSDTLLTSILKLPDWVECACIGFTRYDLRESQRREIVRIRQIAESVGPSSSVHTSRYLDLVGGEFMTSPSIRCVLMFLLYDPDAEYVESVERYLFEWDVAYPCLADRSLRDVLVPSGDVRDWKTSY